MDFKEWNARSRNDAIALVVEMAICMANGGGGTTVFGVSDREIGRSKALLGIPQDLDANLLKRIVYDRTDPKLTPVFEDVHVSEGTGRLLMMHVLPGFPPYTDTAGAAKVRVGTDCLPLTGTMRRHVMVETGETDFTAVEVDASLPASIFPVAMERLREIARRERAPEDLNLNLNFTRFSRASGVGFSSGDGLYGVGLLEG